MISIKNLNALKEKCPEVAIGCIEAKVKLEEETKKEL